MSINKRCLAVNCLITFLEDLKMNDGKDLNIRLVVFTFMAALILAVPVSGRNIYVDPNGSSDFTTIHAAIDDANDGDEIKVAPGTYYEAINFNGKAIELRSSNPNDPNIVAATVIDGTGNYHVVQCVSGEDANTILEGFTITGGNANGDIFLQKYGGGMFNNGSSPTITNCIFSGNMASVYGGGMYNWINSNPTVANCTFSGNTSSEYGGGMYNSSSSPTFCGRSIW
jgi:parallel beta-helix repeat protein